MMTMKTAADEYTTCIGSLSNTPPARDRYGTTRGKKGRYDFRKGEG